MWAQYRRTAPFIQTTILIVTIAVYFLTGRQWMAALVFFAVMQVGAVFGAAWGASLKSRIQQRSEDLPLHRRGL